MIIKIIGAIMIFLSSGAYGMINAGKLEKQLAQTRDLRTGLNSVKQEIYLCGVPLGEALVNAAGVMQSEMKEIFISCGAAISKNSGVSFKDVILSYVAEQEILLSSESKSVLVRWASSAGTGDRRAEYESIEYAISQLDAVIDNCEKECSKKTKLYRSSGFLIGAFAAAVLL